MRVLASTSLSYKGRDVKLREIARELGVRFVLTGSVIRSGDRVRVRAELIDALTGKQRFDEKWDRKDDDMIAILDGISDKLATEMQVALTVGMQASGWRVAVGSWQAMG